MTTTHKSTKEGMLRLRGRVGIPTHEKTKDGILRMRGRMRVRAEAPIQNKTK